MDRRQYSMLARDQSEFDLEVVRSALKHYNDVYGYHGSSSQPRVIAANYLWIPPVLAMRAKQYGIPPQDVTWQKNESVEAIAAAGSALMFTIGAFKLIAGDISISGPKGIKTFSAEEWFNYITAALPIYTRFKSENGKIGEVSIPLLTNVQRCVAYAIALVKMDKYGLGSLVRHCEFLADKRPGAMSHHYFLASDAREKYCCTSHGNAHRQQEYRTRQKTAPGSIAK